MSNKIQKILLSFFIVYAVIGFFILPLIVKSKIIELVAEKTYAKLSIDAVSFNPFIFKLQIEGVKLTALDDKPLLALKSLLLNVELYSLAKSAVHVSELILEEPKIFLVYHEDKTLNFLTLLKPDEDDNTTTEIPRIIVDTMAIQNGTLNYEDFTKKSKFDFSWHEIGFELKNVDTHDFNTSNAEIRLHSSLDDGGFIDLKSKIGGFQPLVVAGSLNFEASKLYTHWRYIKDSLHLEVADGKLSFDTQYYFNLDDLNATKLYNLNVSLENLRVKPTDKNQDILNLGSFYVRQATIQPMLKDVHVDTIGLNGLYTKVNRDSNGKIDWLEYTKTKEQNGVSKQEKEEQNSSGQEEQNSSMWKVKVDKIELEKIKVDFCDKAIHPQVNTKLNELNLHMQNMTLAGVEPLLYQIDMRLNEKLRCSSSGALSHKKFVLESSLKCSDFDVVPYEPYIKQAAKKALEVYDLDLQTAEVDFDANVSVKDVASEIVLNVNDANFELSNFALNKSSTQEKLVDFSSLNLRAIKLNSKTKDVNIDKVMLSDLDIKSVRYKNERLNFEDLVVAHVKPKQNKSAQTTSLKNNKDEKSYRMKLNHFGLNSAQVSFEDRVLNPSFTNKIDKINLNAYDIDSEENSSLKYDLALRVNSRGTAKSSGKIRHSSLRAEGVFELDKILLTPLSPYIKESSYASIDDGYLSFKAKYAYAKSEKNPDLFMKGSFGLQNLYVSDGRDASSLISVEDLGLKSFTLEVAPNRLFIDEINLDTLYVNALIDKNKNLNFASLQKQEVQNVQTPKTLPAPKSSHEEANEAFPIKIAKLNITNSSAKFADLSLLLPFQTNIHDLNGVIYAISNASGETSQVDVKGQVDKYGSTHLKGSVNAGNPKEYMDLNFDFRNLELNSVSGYSASFAGHKIDSGKLFLELGYAISDAQLLAKNSIIIKNIKLGDEIEDENITSLPLGFVIALLEDDEGIIDIDLPIEGNVDAPDFKYGALVFKTIGNLIVQAVTSPFRFLGSMMGMDTQNLEYAEFESGYAKIVSSEQEKLDNIAKMMTKRPKIGLSIAPIYDEEADKGALQGQKLAEMIVQKSGIKNKEDHENAMTADLLEDVYESFRNDDALSKIKDELKTKYKEDALKRAYLTALVAKCKEVQPVSKEELELLATNRATVLKAYLVDEKNIDQERIKVVKTDTVRAENEKWVRSKLKIEVE